MEVTPDESKIESLRAEYEQKPGIYKVVTDMLEKMRSKDNEVLTGAL